MLLLCFKTNYIVIAYESFPFIRNSIYYYYIYSCYRITINVCITMSFVTRFKSSYYLYSYIH